MEITAARGVVGAEAVSDALDLLTEIAAPLRVRLALRDHVLGLTTHGDEPWWATVAVPLVAGGEGEAAATVPRLDLRQAVDAEALLVPDATCAVTIVDDDVVRYGAFALVAAEDAVPPPPGPAGPEIRLGTWEVAGGRYEADDGRVLVASASATDRFVARGIEDLVLVDDPSGPFLLGHELGSGPSELVLLVGGEWVRR